MQNFETNNTRIQINKKIMPFWLENKRNAKFLSIISEVVLTYRQDENPENFEKFPFHLTIFVPVLRTPSCPPFGLGNASDVGLPVFKHVTIRS